MPPLIPPQPTPFRWSVMIPVYNCIGYLPEALRSVLEQDPGEEIMQIEVWDDASTDGDVEALVAAIGKGRIAYRRQPENRGSLQNFHDCLLAARGGLVHLLHGDDYVLPGFYSKMDELFKNNPSVGAACCRYQFVDEESRILSAEIEEQEEGILNDWLYKLSLKQRTQYCAMVVKRSVYEDLGSFYGVNYGEDWEMWARIASKYPVAYTPRLLSAYRRQMNSISGAAKKSGENMHKILWAIDRIQEFLPEDQRPRSRRTAIKWYARYTMASAFTAWVKTRDSKLALGLGRSALSLHPEPYLYWRILLLRIRIIAGR